MPSITLLFTSAPKPAARVARVHRLDVVAVDAEPVPDAVVAREVGRGLSRRDQVVGRKPVAHLGHRDLFDLRTHPASASAAAADSGSDLGIRTFDQLFHHPDADTFDSAVAHRPQSAGDGLSSDVESRGSCPAITSNTSAASATEVVIGPIWSRELANATSP